MKNTLLYVAGVAIGLMLALPHDASAHAFIDHAEPRVGSIIDGRPAEVKVWFTEDLEPASSTIQVFDADGKEVDRKDAHADPHDDAVLIVSLPPLSAGTYSVVWRVTCTCSHKTHGSYKFNVTPT